MSESTQKKTLVLVHGAWMGSWEWGIIVPYFAQLGYRVHIVDLVSIESDSATLRVSA